METIGAEAAKLAGLQIDQLSKIRAGQLSLDQLERFLNLKPEDREERFGDWKRPASVVETAKPVVMHTEQFELLADLGIITVPMDYVHANHIERFMKRNCKKFYSVNENITDANFSNPSRVLKAGDKLTIRVFRQVVGRTTSEERMAFLKTQNAVLTGAQGLTLVFDQKRDQLPKGYWYPSFDEKERLWQDAVRAHRVPGVGARRDGGFYFSLDFFEGEWFDNRALLVFCDLPSGA